MRGLGVVCGSVGPFGDLNKFDVTLVVSLRSEMMSVGRVLSLLIVFRLGWPFGGPTNVQLQVLLFFLYEELQVVGGWTFVLPVVLLCVWNASALSS